MSRYQLSVHDGGRIWMPFPAYGTCRAGLMHEWLDGRGQVAIARLSCRHGVRSSYGGRRVGASASGQGPAGPRVRAAAGRPGDGACRADVAVTVLSPVPRSIRRYTVRLLAGQAGGTGDGAVAVRPHVGD